MCARVSHSRLHSDTCGLSFLTTSSEIIEMEEKIDALIQSVDNLKRTQAGDQQDLQRRLDQLEKDMAIDQEEATQWVIKKLKEDQTFTFKKKGNEKQFIFNDNVKNQFLATGNIWTASRQPMTRVEKYWRKRRGN